MRRKVVLFAGDFYLASTSATAPIENVLFAPTVFETDENIERIGLYTESAMDEIVDVLMITYNRPKHTRMALEHLLVNCDERSRIWLWHNGDDEETLEFVKSLSGEPQVYAFHHSRENVRLFPPTSWLLEKGTGTFLSKVDDDCLVPVGWLRELRSIHAAAPQCGVLGCWRFLEEDFDVKLASRKIQEIAPGRKILRNPWVEGSGFVMKRACVEKDGGLRKGETFTQYCLRLALKGWVNGWVYPFLWQEHLDDPRAPHALIRTDDDFRRYLPLSASRFGANNMRDWDLQLRRSARNLQEIPWDARYYVGWRRRWKQLQNWLR